jgi:DNA-binding transcriptional LysR family regulator
MLDLYHLQSLAEFARLGSYSAVAKSLGFTQPAISYRMRALERALGTKLVVKVGRGAQLTSEGENLARRAEELLASLRALEKEFQSYCLPLAREVKVAAIHSASASIVPQAFARLQTTHPHVAVAIHRATCLDAYRMLRAGQVDLAIMAAVPPADGLVTQMPEFDPAMLKIPLAIDQKCVVLPSWHSLAARETVRLEDLAGESWIVEGDRSNRREFEADCRAAGFEANVIATTDDQDAVHQMVGDGVGVAMTDCLAAVRCRSENVAVCLLADRPPRHVFGMLWPDMIRVPAVAALVQALRSTVSDSFPDRSAGIRAAWVTAL